MEQKIELEFPRNPLREGVITGILAIIVLESLTYFIYFYATEAQKGEILEGLNRTANVAQTVIDPDLHRQWRNPEQEADSVFQAETAKLGAILNSDTTIEFVYTVIQEESGAYHFVIDPTPPGDANGDGVEDAVDLMDEWGDAPPEVVACFSEQQKMLTEDVYYDQWGGHIGCYLPIFSSDGEFEAVLGINISAAHYIERQWPIQEAWIRASLAILFISFLFGVCVWFLRKYQKLISPQISKK